jgi:hypothetical protein
VISGRVLVTRQFKTLPGAQAQRRAEELAVVNGAHYFLPADVDRLTGDGHRRVEHTVLADELFRLRIRWPLEGGCRRGLRADRPSLREQARTLSGRHERIAVEIASARLSPPPQDASLADQLRHALRSHIDYIDTYSDSFVAFVRGALGSDPDQQSAVDGLRWLGAQRILLALGIVEPFPPILRTAMHGWVGHLDEMMIDRITHRDVDVEVLVELAATTLVTTLRGAAMLDPSLTLAAPVDDALDTFTVLHATQDNQVCDVASRD